MLCRVKYTEQQGLLKSGQTTVAPGVWQQQPPVKELAYLSAKVHIGQKQNKLSRAIHMERRATSNVPGKPNPNNRILSPQSVPHPQIYKVWKNSLHLASSSTTAIQGKNNK